MSISYKTTLMLVIDLETVGEKSDSYRIALISN